MSQASILIVEDEHIIAMDIQNYLEHKGYQVAGYADRGNEAIKKAQELHPDLILMDISLKGDMDGIEAATQIRERFDLPVIFLTSFSNQSTIERARLAEAFGYILKPFQERELIITIEMALYKHSMEHKLREKEAQLEVLVKQLQQRSGELEGQTQELGRSNALLSALHGMAARLPISQSQDEIFAILGEELKHAKLEHVIEEYDPLTDELVVHSVSVESGLYRTAERIIGKRLKGLRIPIREQLLEKIIHQEQPVFQADPVAEISALDLGLPKSVVQQIAKLVFGKSGTRLLLLPLTFGERVFGLLSVWDTRLQAEDVKTFQVFATQVAIALENSRLLAESRASLLQIEKQAQQLAASETHFRTLLENAYDAILLIDAHGNIRYASPSTSRVIGYTLEELAGRGMRGHADDLPIIEKTKTELISQPGITRRMEFRFKTKAGDWRWLAATAVNLLDNPAVKALVINFHDITERKQAEAALQESELKYRTLFERVPIGLYRTSPDGGILDANQALLQMFGYADRESVLGADMANAYASREESASWLKRITLDTTHINGETLFRRKDDSTFPAQFAIRVARDEAGKVLYLEGSLVDVTENRRARLEIEKKARTMTSLYETALDLISEHDLPKLLRVIVQRAASLLDAGGGGLYLCEPDRGQVRCVISYNTPRDYSGTILKYGDGAAGHVAQTGQPLIINDYPTWDGRAKVYEREKPFRKVLSVPMIWQDEVIGVLHVLGYEERAADFTEDDQKLAILFASQAAIAIQNARLIEQVQSHAADLEKRVAERTQELQERSAELENIQQITEELLSTIDLPAIEAGVVRHIADVFNMDRVAIMRFSEQEGVLSGLAMYPPYSKKISSLFRKAHFGELRIQYVFGQNPFCDELFVNKKPLLSHSFAEVTKSFFPKVAMEAAQRLSGNKTYLGIPLIAEGHIVGALLVVTQRETITAREQASFALVAGQAAVAISRAQHFQAAQRRAAELESIHRITEKLLSTEDIGAIQETVVESVGKLLDLSLAMIALYNESVFTSVAVYPKPTENMQKLFGMVDVAKYNFPYEPGINPLMDEAIQNKRTFVTHSFADIATPYVPRTVAETTQRYYKTQIYAGLPLVIENRTIGLLLVGTTRKNFKDDERAALELVAGQTAVAISRAWHYRAAQERAAELENIHRITEKLLSTEELETIQATVTQGIATLLNFESTTIVLYDESDSAFLPASIYPPIPEQVLKLPGLSQILNANIPYQPGKNHLLDRLIRDRQSVSTDSMAELMEHYLPEQVAEISQRMYNIQFYFGLPLINENHTIGILLVSSKRSEISARERSALELIAGQLAVAISRAGHYQLAQKRATELAQTMLQMEHEIDERKQAEARLTTSLKEKEVLLREVYHRVKNNLQVVGSLINLQASQVKDEATRVMFQQTRSRINVMALVHEKLYQSPNLAKIDFSEYLKLLTHNLFRAYLERPSGLHLDLKVEPAWLGLDTAIPCGLILNELIANSLEHAFPAVRRDQPPKISVELHNCGINRYELTVSDNGVGLPEGLDWQNTKSLGLQLVNLLSSQISGEVRLEIDQGTKFTIVFSEVKYKERG